jgi:glyoxylase-like metal-dependent hydrolase (beta-lactamase superfamily II)
MATVQIVIQPLVVRMSLHNGAPIYHIAGDPWVQLDGLEEALGKSPHAGAAFGDLAFIPICHTVLLRAHNTILVDPGNMHLGLSGLLRWRLKSLGVAVEGVDVVVATHSHHDHLSSIGVVRGRPLVIGARERDLLVRNFWPAYAEAFTTGAASQVREVGPNPIELDEGITVIPTPGHTPGSLSVLVAAGEERVAIVGDTAMTQAEYETRRLSHWYTDEQVAAINASLDRIVAWEPTIVIPGHDRAFRPGGPAFDATSQVWGDSGVAPL